MQLVQPASPGVAGETQETGKPCLDRGDAVERSSAFSLSSNMYGLVLLPLVTLYNLFSIFNIRHPDEQEVLESLTLDMLIFDTKR